MSAWVRQEGAIRLGSIQRCAVRDEEHSSFLITSAPEDADPGDAGVAARLIGTITVRHRTRID
ncbi:hypothetical protein, partial [Enterobacter bugandensis]|uniref:hypothetical protein n=1 Tax=Enterobacter bugandensis TaxID=881260 RepID=UPI001954F76C